MRHAKSFSTNIDIADPSAEACEPVTPTRSVPVQSAASSAGIEIISLLLSRAAEMEPDSADRLRLYENASSRPVPTLSTSSTRPDSRNRWTSDCDSRSLIELPVILSFIVQVLAKRPETGTAALFRASSLGRGRLPRGHIRRAAPCRSASMLR